MPPIMHRSTALRITVGALIALLGACTHVPTIPEPLSTEVAAQINVTGAHGSLSQRETNALLKRLAAQAPDADALQRHIAVEQTVAGTPLFTGNRVNILQDGEQTFAASFAAIHGAQRYLYLEYYILEDVQQNGEQLSDALIERRQAGVQIDVMYDSIGSLATPASFFDRLRAAGIKVQPFNPLRGRLLSINDRDHRKLLLADGGTALLGGVNLSTSYQSSAFGADSNQPNAHEPWHDTDLEIAGPAVRELEQLFEAHWRSQGGAQSDLAAAEATPAAQGDQVVRIIGSQAGDRLSPRYYATVLSAIRSAASRIDITAAYFAPTHQENQALLHAARRGVSVRLLLPSHSDSSAALAVQHSHYHALLKAGVHIFERADGILHSKTMVTDGVWSVVGSSNFDHRSVLFNDEIDAVVIGSQTGAELQRLFDQGLSHAQSIDDATWERRPTSQRLRERFWRLWEQLL
jgi:cardiolipin synthase A/B